MRKAGLSSINVGVESASDDLLTKATRKTIERSHQDEIIRYCEDSGVKVAAFYILGLLGETRQSALNTINYAKRLNTTVAQFTVMTPFPGSDFYKQMEAEGRIDPTVPLYDYDSYTPVVKHPTLARAELNALKEKAFTDYYFRPAYAAKFVRQKLLG
jgi:radical SAM superfamily enzyme YgiQ (UPF0313 family)